ncbi:hypothetical protein AN618_21390 [Fervidicola ferrireducens]|uniref:Copper amine oxidase-like N-terminal domain-containing protein n=1 Tax=Fervidicola ferrireducens TaxID=520764 RepID=A0A140L2Y9_9FIRM|nr:hypothetical protein [Fervidicola ferrireducens]KXG74914.1 hypothetical protein AN618_21390 [Fervidicola ferrireducens]
MRPSILRKALALTLVLAFTLAAVPPQARAEVLETKLAIVYTGADAVQQAQTFQAKYNLKIWPLKAVYTHSGQGVINWASGWGAGAEQWVRDTEIFTALEKLEQTIPALVYLIPKQRILILPLYAFRTSTASSTSGVYFSPNLIYLAGQRVSASYALLHELGHAVCDALLNTEGYDFSHINLLGREYLRLRGYPKNVGLTASAQTKLDWDQRAAEYFAEDFAYWVACKLGLNRYIHIPGTGSPEVLKWFDRVLGDATTSVYAYTAEGVVEAQGREVVFGKVYVPLQFFRELGFSSDELLAVLPRIYPESYAIKDTIYVPLRRAATQLGLVVYWDGRAVYVRR